MEQADVVRHALEVLERMGLPYAVVGSYASSAWGEPRYTHDIDIVLDLPMGRVQELCTGFPPPEWYVSETAAREAVSRRRQFNIIHTSSGNKIDVMVPRSDEWSREQLQRRQKVALLPDREGYAAHPEDVIIGKLRYFHEGGSDKHLRDIAGILQVSGELVDRASVRRWAEKLGVTEAWDAVLSRLDQAAHGQK